MFMVKNMIEKCECCQKMFRFYIRDTDDKKHAMAIAKAYANQIEGEYKNGISLKPIYVEVFWQHTMYIADIIAELTYKIGEI